MAEPFSIAASALAMIGTPAKIGHEIHTFFNSFKESQANLKAVCADFDETVSILKIIEAQNSILASTEGSLSDERTLVEE